MCFVFKRQDFVPRAVGICPLHVAGCIRGMAKLSFPWWIPAKRITYYLNLKNPFLKLTPNLRDCQMKERLSKEILIVYAENLLIIFYFISGYFFVTGMGLWD